MKIPVVRQKRYKCEIKMNQLKQGYKRGLKLTSWIAGGMTGATFTTERTIVPDMVLTSAKRVSASLPK